MVKTNFTKVEEMLSEGLRKMSIDRLLDITDTSKQAEDQSAEKAPAPPLPEQTQLISLLQHELSSLQKKGIKVYETLGIKKSYLKKLAAQGLTSEEWEKVKKIKAQLDEYKKENSKNFPSPENEDLIEAERKSHKTKRFNINKNWLPLH